MDKPRNAPGWAVELTGEKFDLDTLSALLPAGYEPFAEDYQEEEGRTVVLLRSREWLTMESGHDVSRHARQQVTMLNGLLLLFDLDARPVTTGRVLKFKPDGTREHVLVAETGYFNIREGRDRVRMTVSTGGPPPTPSETKMQEQARKAATDPFREELLRTLSRADDWVELYKAIELANRMMNGRSNPQKALGGDFQKWRTIKRTADYEQRHAKSTRMPPEDSVTWDDARDFVIRQVSRLLLTEGL
jgi:hypothetical protein